MSAKIEEQALSRAVSSQAMSNYPAIFDGFMSKGLDPDDIKPRENIFTYDAWRALGRQVRRSEHGVQVITWIPIERRNAESGELEVTGKRCKTTTVFHVSQTDPIAPRGAQVPQC